MTGAILAGGKSRRMGRNKAFLDVDGRPIIDRTVGLFREIFGHVMIVTNSAIDYAYLGVPVVTDLLPGYGALGGLHSALFFAPDPHVFVAACDMPFLNREVIEYILSLPRRGRDILVPQLGPHLEPLHAIYSKRCLKPIEASLDEGEKKIVAFFRKVRAHRIPEERLRELDPGLRSFLNVNTTDDLALIQ